MRRLFRTVAPRYDFITRVFSYGLDAGWKRCAVDRAGLKDGAFVLDLACGTGDFSKIVRQRVARSRTAAADLTFEMLARAGVPNRVCTDALRLPFADRSFDAVFAGYGIRNFPDLRGSLEEIRRVLRPSGVLASLDFFLPENAAYRPLFIAYLYAQGAFWGTLLHGSPHVYTYIPASLRSFVSATEFRRVLSEQRYTNIRERKLLGGGLALHWAVRAG